MSNTLTQDNKPAVPVAQAVLGFASVGATYAQVTSFTSSLLIVIIYSSFNKDVQFSWDGVNDFIPIPTLQQVQFQFKTNHLVMPAQFGAFIKQIGTAPTSGNLYISGFTQV